MTVERWICLSIVHTFLYFQQSQRKIRRVTAISCHNDPTDIVRTPCPFSVVGWSPYCWRHFSSRARLHGDFYRLIIDLAGTANSRSIHRQLSHSVSSLLYRFSVPFTVAKCRYVIEQRRTEAANECAIKKEEEKNPTSSEMIVRCTYLAGNCRLSENAS